MILSYLQKLGVLECVYKGHLHLSSKSCNFDTLDFIPSRPFNSFKLDTLICPPTPPFNSYHYIIKMTTIEMLPQELIDAIAGYLPKGPHRAQCAALSISWQRAIEKLTFSSLSIRPGDHLGQVHEFEQCVTPRRFGYIRELHIRFYVIDLRVSARRDSVFNEQLTQTVLIERLRKLFEIMAARNSFLKDEVGTGYVRSGISLYLEPMFGFYLEESDSEHIPECSDTADYKSLPELDFVTRLQLRDKSTILPLGSGFLLSSRLPKLHGIELETSLRPEIWYSKWLHIDDRRHLERAITDTGITDKFRSGHFTLNIWARDDYEKTTPSLEVVFDDTLFGITRPSYDPMSMSIRNFSQNLTSLNLSANLNASIFWPQPHEPDDNKNSIPH